MNNSKQLSSTFRLPLSKVKFISSLRGLIWFPVIALLLMGCTSISLPFPSVPPAPQERELSPTHMPTSPLAVVNLNQEDTELVDLYKRVNQAVVNITIYGGQDGQVFAAGAGSGFVYDQTGTIVTNAHVVEGANQVEVTFSDRTILKAEIAGQDPQSDLAVLTVPELPDGVTPLVLGDVGELAVGQTVVAIGNPFGLQGTLTRGIISALGRTIPALTPFSIPQAIQTDAAINPGNSGGPLLDLHGHVIGINAQIETDGTSRTSSGVGFAIPVNIIQRVIPVLIEKGRYEWSWLGVRGNSVTPVLVEAMKLPIDQGAYIAEIIPGGPAEKAGLQGAIDTEVVNDRGVETGGDVVTAIEGQPVRSFDDLLVYVALQTSPGQDVKLTILRNGQNQEVVVRLEKRPESLKTEQPITPFPNP